MCVFIYLGRRGGYSKYRKYPKVCFTFFGIQRALLELGQCRNKKRNCNFIDCSQSKHIIVYYGERERGKIICLNASRKES